MKLFIVALASLFPSLLAHADNVPSPTPSPPPADKLKVAFVISQGANVMDIAGPWEVFQDTELVDGHGKEIGAYKLFTVAPSKTPLHATGGLTLVPDYTFADAPAPDIIVVGAQSGGPGLSNWLQKQHHEHKTIVSICTGAFKLGEAGLLDDKPATTHHYYFGDFAAKFPKTKLMRQVRYVRADGDTFTAGGLTSGVDLALHLVAERFGTRVAQTTADYMEYQGTGWKSNQGISELSTPIKREDWAGTLAPGSPITVHIVVHGASVSSITSDLPKQHVTGAPTRVTSGAAGVKLELDIAGHPATILGKPERDGTRLVGTFTQDGKAHPLTLEQHIKTSE